MISAKSNEQIELVDDLSVLHENFSPYACQIKTDIGVGSGSLISSDGFILTCDHVLHGDDLKVIFKEGDQDKEYIAKIVFSDEINDIAIIKADGLNSKSWLDVDLNRDIKPGEKVFCISNPFIVSDTAKSAITDGSVSSVDVKKYGEETMAINIAIASGSSGAPIISKKTGKIVGVVQAVQSSKVDKKIGKPSSSGFFCIASPTKNFNKLLGITYRD